VEALIGLPLVVGVLFLLASLVCIFGYFRTKKRVWLLAAGIAFVFSGLAIVFS
jgi:hypothetical protein